MTDYTFLKKLQSGEACYGMMAFEFMTPGLPSIVKELRPGVTAFESHDEDLEAVFDYLVG